MSEAQAQPPRFSPWFSMWLKPRDTISRIIARNPRRGVLLLATLAGMGYVISNLFNFGFATDVFDKRMILLVIGAVLLFALFNLYLYAPLTAWSGRLLGGRASIVEVRAAIAWSFVPSVASLLAYVISFAILKVLKIDTLLFAQVIAGILACWSLVAMTLMLSRVQAFGVLRAIANFVLSIILAVGISILIRTFLFQPFNIPSRAMEPTFLVGDYFFVSKFSYGYNRYSLPFSLPLFSGRIFASDPKRGDVVIFRLPSDDSVTYVKRIVGLPGDRIQMIQGVLNINGVPVKIERAADWIPADGEGAGLRIKRWRETLPNGMSYETLDLVDNGFYDNTPVYEVPAGHFFMLGDNRDNSTDSRARAIGFIPLDHIVGRATMIFFSVARENPAKPALVRFERLGMTVH
jgi:signal peptidase I